MQSPDFLTRPQPAQTRRSSFRKCFSLMHLQLHPQLESVHKPLSFTSQFLTTQSKLSISLLVFSDGGEQRGGSDVRGARVGLREDLSTAAGLQGPAGRAPPASSGRAVHQKRHVAKQQPVREARRQSAGSSSSSSETEASPEQKLIRVHADCLSVTRMGSIPPCLPMGSV